MEPAEKPLSRLVRAYWLAYFGAQLIIARVLTIDFFDAFVYLRDARRLAGAPIGFTADRPPLLPLLHAPLQALLNLGAAAPAARLWVPHVFEVFISAACLVVVHRYLRRSLSPGWAQFGTIVFSLNRLIVHYFSSVLTDIPATALLLLVFMLEEKAAETNSRGAEALAAVALAGCLLCRWNMLLAPAGLALRGLRPRSPSRLKRIARISAAAIASMAAVMLVLYKAVYPMSLFNAGGFFLANLRTQSINNVASGPLSAYLDSLAVSFGLAPFLLLLYGLSLAPGTPPGGFFNFAFLAYFMAVMTFAVGHKESRYVLPVLPMLCLFLSEGVKRLREKAPKHLRGALVAAVLLACAAPAAREFRRFLDSAFRSPVLLDAADALARRTASARTLYWDGYARSIYPADPVFARGDPFYYLYHVPSLESMEYLLGRPFASLAKGPVPAPGDALVRAPARLYRLNRPLPPEENRLDVLVYSGARRWEPAGSF